MADNQRNQNDTDPQKDTDMSQMGGTASQSGQKGGQAQTDMSQENYSRGDTDTSLGDEDL